MALRPAVCRERPADEHRGGPGNLTVVHSAHPLLPLAGRSVRQCEFPPGTTVEEALIALDLHPGRALAAVTLDGEYLPRERWATVCPRPGQIVQVQIQAQGGKGGSNPLQIVLTIAAIAFAAWAGPALAGLAGLSTGTTIAGVSISGATFGSLFSGLTMMAGSLLIGALLPAPAARIGSGTDLPNQTYSLTGGQNAARPWQPMPLVMGEHRVYPDLTAQSTRYQGNEQWLSMIFCYGLTDMAAPTDHKIGDTPLANFQGVTTQWAPNGAAVTLVAEDVYVEALSVDLTQDGAAYPLNSPSGATWSGAGAATPYINTTDADAGWRQRTSAPDAIWLQVDIVGKVFCTLKTVQAHDRIRIDIHFRAVGATEWSDAGSLIIASNRQNDLRRSRRWAVGQGQYQVRVRAVGDYYDGGAEYTSRTRKATWTALSTGQRETADYTGQYRLAFRARSSGQLNGTVDQFSSLCKGRCITWTGTAWTGAVETRNAAWWFLWFARGKRDADGRLLFGVGMPDARIDIETIKAWGAACDINGWTVDGLIDAQQTRREVLEKIAQCGRASLTFHTGKLGVVWEEADAPVVATIGPFNIRKGTFQVGYISENLADEIQVGFVNAAAGYTADSVRVPVPDAHDPPQRIARVEAWGKTASAAATYWGRRLAASQTYHRRRITWEMDLEAMMLARGDIAQLTHDMTRWDAGGRLAGYDPLTNTLTLDRDVDRAAPNWITLRWPNGFFQTFPCAAGTGTGNTVQLNQALPSMDGDGNPLADPGTDAHPVWDWTYQYGPHATPGKRVLIVNIKPLSLHHVQIEATDDNPAYYTYAGGAYQSQTVGAVPDYTPQDLRYAETLLRIEPAGGVSRIALSWTGLTGAHYLVRRQTSLWFNGAWAVMHEWEDVQRSSAAAFEQEAPEGVRLEFEVSPIFAGRGLFGAATLTVDVQGRAAPPDDVAGLGWAFDAAHNVRLSWTANDDIDLLRYEIRRGAVGAAWGAASAVVATVETSYTVLGLAGDFDYLIKAIDSSGNESANAARVSVATTVSELAGGTLRDGVYTATVGASITLDIDSYGVFDITLSQADCAIQFSVTPVPGTFCQFALRLRRYAPDGVVTWPNTITWSGATQNAATWELYAFVSLDGGATWIGYLAAYQ